MNGKNMNRNDTIYTNRTGLCKYHNLNIKSSTKVVYNQGKCKELNRISQQSKLLGLGFLLLRVLSLDGSRGSRRWVGLVNVGVLLVHMFFQNLPPPAPVTTTKGAL